jgi:hypothetical protein
MLEMLRLASQDPQFAASCVAELRDAGADAQAAEDAAASLANVLRLSEDDSGTCVRGGVFAAGALPAVLNALRAHPARASLAESCMYVLSQLGDHSAAAARAARDTGAVAPPRPLWRRTRRTLMP